MPNQDDTGFPKLSAPTRRALARAGHTRLEQLAPVPESEIEQLHGVGPTGITALRDALDERDSRSATSAGGGFRWPG